MDRRAWGKIALFLYGSVGRYRDDGSTGLSTIHCEFTAEKILSTHNTPARTHTPTQTDVFRPRGNRVCAVVATQTTTTTPIPPSIPLFCCSGSSRDQLTFSDSFEGVLAEAVFRGHPARTIRTENGPFRDGTRHPECAIPRKRHDSRKGKEKCHDPTTTMRALLKLLLRAERTKPASDGHGT